jgi:hypothetical protein
VEPIDLLKAIHKKIIDFRAKSGFGENAFAKKATLPPTALVPIEEIKVTPKGKIRTIDLLTLLKIFNGHPALKEDVLDYLRTNTDEKHTPDLKNMDIEKLQEDLKIKDGMIRWLDEEKTKIQRKLDNKEEECKKLEAENQSLRKRLIDAGIPDNPKK